MTSQFCNYHIHVNNFRYTIIDVYMYIRRTYIYRMTYIYIQNEVLYNIYKLLTARLPKVKWCYRNNSSLYMELTHQRAHGKLFPLHTIFNSIRLFECSVLIVVLGTFLVRTGSLTCSLTVRVCSVGNYRGCFGYVLEYYTWKYKRGLFIMYLRL